MNKELRIAIKGGDFLWGGGTDFIRNVANALLFVKSEYNIKLFLFLPVWNRIDTFCDARKLIWNIATKTIRERKIVIPREEPIVDSSYLDYFKNVDGELHLVEYNMETGLIPALQRIKADVVIPVGYSLGESFPIPWVGYIYDFQHKYFPNFFNAKECLNRDIFFATMIRDVKAVIVHSQSVKEDIDKFYPYHKCKVFNLPFSAAPVASWLEDENPDQLAGYNLPTLYFLISNQFFIHKSHSTAFQALSMILNDHSCPEIHIVCTGKMEDPRFPDHIKDLKQKIHDLEVEDKVHFLGHIPKIDQIAIMKKSLAVLQPTLFEGASGGGSVCDAVSLGVPVIISDIPVNKEIENEENLFYFKAGSSSDLADKIRIFLKKNNRRPTKEELILSGKLRKGLFGERLLEAIRYVSEYSTTN